MKTYNNPCETGSLINNLAGIFYLFKDDFSKATYIDQESGRDKRFGELPVFSLSKTIYRYLKKEEKRIIIVIKMMMMMMMMMMITALNIFGITECF